MKDTDLYLQILGLSAPGFVADVELGTTVGHVDVHVDHATGDLPQNRRNRAGVLS